VSPLGELNSEISGDEFSRKDILIREADKADDIEPMWVFISKWHDE
jgi:hypothetical protein